MENYDEEKLKHTINKMGIDNLRITLSSKSVEQGKYLIKN